MAMDAKSVEIIIKAQDDASAALKKISDEFKKFGNETQKVAKLNFSSITSSLRGVASAFADIGKQAAGFAAAQMAVAGLSISVSTLKESFIDYNASMEQTRIGFATMLKSATAADSFIKDLQKFAAETPFEFPELQGAAKRMLAFGWAAQDVIPTLTAIGNAASGLGIGAEGIDRVTMALGQMKAKGKVQGEEILQLAEAGIPAYEILATKLKLTGEQVANIGNQGISADAAIKALTEGMNERFAGMLDAQSKTFTGLLSTVRDNVGQTMGAIGQDFFNSAKAMLQPIADLTSEIAAQIRVNGLEQAFENMFPESFQGAVKALISDFQAMGERLADIGMRFLQAETGMKAFENGLILIDTAAGTLIDTLDYLSVATDFWIKKGEWALNLMGQVSAEAGQTIANAKNFFNPQSTKVEDLTGSTKSIDRGFSDFGDGDLPKTPLGPQTYWESIGSQIKEGFSKATDVFKTEKAKLDKLAKENALGFESTLKYKGDALAADVLNAVKKPAITKSGGAKKSGGGGRGRSRSTSGADYNESDFMGLDNALGDWATATQLDLNQKAIDDQKEMEMERQKKIEEYDIQLEFNKLKLDLNEGSEAEINQMNRDILDNKIQFLQDELSMETEVTQETLKMRRELAEALKQYNNTPTNGSEAFAMGFQNTIKGFGTYFDDLKKMAETTATAMRDSLSEFFFDAVTGKLKSFGDYVRNFAQSMAKALSQMLANSLMRSLFGGSGSGGGGFLGGLFGGARANGGDVTGGRTYLVGERGPELFTAPANGAIIPNNQMAAAGAGGVYITMNIQTQNADSFRASKGQLITDMQNALRWGGRLA